MVRHSVSGVEEQTMKPDILLGTLDRLLPNISMVEHVMVDAPKYRGLPGMSEVQSAALTNDVTVRQDYPQPIRNGILSCE